MKDSRYPYRFKTLEEFERDYGSSWRNRVMYTFPSTMNFLLGTVYPYNLTDKDFKLGYLNDVHGFSISSSMLICTRKVPSYKPRKMIRDI